MVRYNIVWNGDVSSGCPVRSKTVHVTRRTVSSHRTIRTVRQGRVGRGAVRTCQPCRSCPCGLSAVLDR